MQSVLGTLFCGAPARSPRFIGYVRLCLDFRLERILNWSLYYADISTTTAAVQLPSFTIANDVLWGEMAAFSLLMATPILIMGLLIQRYFVRGLTLGAIKG